MSIVVAVSKDGRAVLACDTMVSVGSTRSVNAAGGSKFIKMGGSLIGWSGYTVYRNILAHYVRTKEGTDLVDEQSVFEFFVGFWHDLHERYHLVNDQCDADNAEASPFADLCAEFIAVNGNGIFRVKEILSVTRFEKFCAIGSGAPHAEGALQILYDQCPTAREIARRAVLVAMEFDRACGGELEIKDVP